MARAVGLNRAETRITKGLINQQCKLSCHISGTEWCCLQ